MFCGHSSAQYELGLGVGVSVMLLRLLHLGENWSTQGTLTSQSVTCGCQMQVRDSGSCYDIVGTQITPDD